jgi:hypothetical protein
MEVPWLACSGLSEEDLDLFLGAFCGSEAVLVDVVVVVLDCAVFSAERISIFFYEQDLVMSPFSTSSPYVFVWEQLYLLLFSSKAKSKNLPYIFVDIKVNGDKTEQEPEILHCFSV